MNYNISKNYKILSTVAIICDIWHLLLKGRKSFPQLSQGPWLGLKIKLIMTN